MTCCILLRLRGPRLVQTTYYRSPPYRVPLPLPSLCTRSPGIDDNLVGPAAKHCRRPWRRGCLRFDDSTSAQMRRVPCTRQSMVDSAGVWLTYDIATPRLYDSTPRCSQHASNKPKLRHNNTMPRRQGCFKLRWVQHTCLQCPLPPYVKQPR